MAMSFLNNKTKLCLKLMGLCLASAMGTAIVSEISSIESYADTSVTWNRVQLSSSGDADWDVTIPHGEAVDIYEIKLARQREGVWDEDYRTYKTSDDGYSFSFTSKAKYRYKIRIKFIGGEYSTWSQDSNTVNVTADDLDDSGPRHSSGGYNYFTPGNTVTSFATSSSPGTMYYPQGYGPGGNSTNSRASVINTITGDAIYRNINGGYTNSNIYSGNTVYNMNPTGVSGFINVNGRFMYVYANGTYPVNSWDRIDNSWYYFDQYGFMHTGWLFLNNNWYYCLPSGKMAESSWNNINEKWYYFNESGVMQTGYIKLGDKIYYTDGSGARVESAYNPDGHLFDINGVMIS